MRNFPGALSPDFFWEDFCGLQWRMKNLQSEKNRELTIRDLYPHLSEAQLKEAEENLGRYLELELRVYERILAAEAYARFRALTASKQRSTMDGERSNPSLTS